MPKNWDLEYYESPNGEIPVYDFIEALDRNAKAKIYFSLELLKEFNITLTKPHVKKIEGSELRELRILGKDSIRIFYIAVVKQKFLLLHGFIKKQQKTPKNELKIAEKRLKDYQNRQKH